MPVVSHGELSPLEWWSVAVIGKQAAAVREKVEPGRGQAVDFLLRVKGSLDVSESGTSTRTTKPDGEAVLAFLLAMAPTQEQREAIRGAMIGARAAGGLPAVEEGFAEAAKQLIAPLGKTSPFKKNGPTRGNFQIGLVAEDQLAEAVQTTITKATRAIALDDI